MAATLPPAVADLLVGACLAVAGTALVWLLLDPSPLVWSDDGRPSYLAAPADSMAVADSSADTWAVWIVCSETGWPWPVSDAPNRSVALDQMEDLPPPERECPPIATEGTA
jgi:hypothetical protein